MYHFNYIFCHSFNATCNSSIKICSLVSEIRKCKDHQFVSEITGAFILCTRGGQSSDNVRIIA